MRTLTSQLHLRVRPDELATIQQTARRSGRSVSDLVRDLAEAERVRLDRIEARRTTR